MHARHASPPRLAGGFRETGRAYPITVGVANAGRGPLYQRPPRLAPRGSARMQTLVQRWVPDDPNHHAGYYAELARLMPDRGRVLDLGCGRNRDLAHFRTADREIWGTDPERHPRLEHAAWFRPLRADFTIPFPDATFDVVACNM